MSDVAAVAAALGVADRTVRELHPGEVVMEAAPAALPVLADRVVSGLGGRLVSLFATDERTSANRFLVHHVWSLPNHRTFLRIAAPMDPAEPSYPSIAARYPAANWFEREVMDFFGLAPRGHPNPARVALHDDWPDEAWPLRKDFPYDRAVRSCTGRLSPVPAGDRRRRVPGAGGARARGHHRAWTFPLWCRR